MDTRKALPNGTRLRFVNGGGAVTVYTIRAELGRGGSCLVYDASYRNRLGQRRTVRIKECYPFAEDIRREAGGALVPAPADEARFDAERRAMEEAFRRGNDLFESAGLTNSVANTLDLYEANNTLYIVTTYEEGRSLSLDMALDLRARVKIVRSTAQAVAGIHARGWLYLDIKPANIFVCPETPELVRLFDFDSLQPWPAPGAAGAQVAGRHAGSAASAEYAGGGAQRSAAGTAAAITDTAAGSRPEATAGGKAAGPWRGDIPLSYTKGFAALELRMADRSKLGPHTDVFGIGALLYYLVFGRVAEAPDCERGARYAYEDAVFEADRYPDRLVAALTDFFRHTLASYLPDRWSDMTPVIASLGQIEALADPRAPFLYPGAPVRQPHLIGRERELRALAAWVSEHRRGVLYVTGMGGIGKSALVRRYLQTAMETEPDRSPESFDYVLYLHADAAAPAPYAGTGRSAHNTDAAQPSQPADLVGRTGALAALIADDDLVRINTVARLPEETTEDYFRRKARRLRELLRGTSSVLVLDGCEGEIDRAFLTLTEMDWRIIVITRTAPAGASGSFISISTDTNCSFNASMNMDASEAAACKPVPGSCAELHLGALSEEAAVRRLFETYLGRALRGDEMPYLAQIAESVASHTLALELIARQVAASCLTLPEAAALTRAHGFAHLAPERVPYEKDALTGRGTIPTILRALYRADNYTEDCRAVLQCLALFGPAGPDLRVLARQPEAGANLRAFAHLLGQPTLDNIRTLIDGGWIGQRTDAITLHPFVREVIRTWPWTDVSLTAADRLFAALAAALRAEGKDEEYTHAPLRDQAHLRALVKMATPIVRASATLQPPFPGGEDDATVGAGIPAPALTALRSCGDLAYYLVMNLPREREAERIALAEALLKRYLAEGAQRDGRGHGDDAARAAQPAAAGKISADDGARARSRAIRLCYLLVLAYGECGAFAEAEGVVRKAAPFARERDPELRARYFDLCANFHDARLQGDYGPDNAYHDREALTQAQEKAVRYMRAAAENGAASGGAANASEGRLWLKLAEYQLGRANVQTRLCPEPQPEEESRQETERRRAGDRRPSGAARPAAKRRQTAAERRVAGIRRMLGEVQRICGEYGAEDVVLRRDWHMSCAWFYTAAEPDYARARAHLQRALERTEKTGESALDVIDIVLIPWANIEAETGHDAEAAEKLQEAIALCEREDCADAVPYRRKKAQLQEYLLEVYACSGAFEPAMAQALLEEIDRANAEYAAEAAAGTAIAAGTAMAAASAANTAAGPAMASPGGAAAPALCTVPPELRAAVRHNSENQEV